MKLYEKGKPFVAYIQIATNHMPFTIPDKKEGFSAILEDEIDEKNCTKKRFSIFRPVKWHSVFGPLCCTVFKKSESIWLL